MALSQIQQDHRRGKLTASRAAVLMNANAEGIMRLYKEMIGEEQPEDLSGVWPVRLGEWTEELNLLWYEMNGNPLSRHGEVVIHKKYDWLAVTLDAWDNLLECPVEAKHVGGREPMEIIIDRYQPQMQCQMEVTGAQICALSVIMGANAPIVEYIDRDNDYIAEMIRRGRQFMDCVKARREPVVLPAVPPPADSTKIIDMTGNNEWAHFADVWLETRPRAILNRDAEKVLKNLVPDDAKKVFGHEVQITRDRANRLSLREIANVSSDEG